MLTKAADQTIQLLPLLLQHGKSFELPIVIIGCKKIILHDLVYKNKSSSDLIKNCTVLVNGKKVRYIKSDQCQKTYYIDGNNNSTLSVDVNPLKHTKFGLEISCGDFSSCGCKENRFQLNISAVYE